MLGGYQQVLFFTIGAWVTCAQCLGMRKIGSLYHIQFLIYLCKFLKFLLPTQFHKVEWMSFHKVASWM